MGTNIPIFNGSGDVVTWATRVKAKLISKGYKSQLLDGKRPADADARALWDTQADKALGTILTYMNPDVTVQFENATTPQTLMEAVVKHYSPDINQEIERLEGELRDITYDGEEPVAWVAKIRSIIAKLTIRNNPPTERTVRAIVLKALEQESEYKIRVEVIRYTQPNINLVDLWTAISRFPYPLGDNESALINATKRLSIASKARKRDKKEGKTHKIEKDKIKPLKCHNCKKKGHRTKDCPKDASSNSDTEEDKKGKSKKEEKTKSKTFTYFAHEVKPAVSETVKIGMKDTEVFTPK